MKFITNVFILGLKKIFDLSNEVLAHRLCVCEETINLWVTSNKSIQIKEKYFPSIRKLIEEYVCPLTLEKQSDFDFIYDFISKEIKKFPHIKLPTKETLLDRELTFKKLYVEYNGNLSSIARELNISRERSRQIAAKYRLRGTGQRTTTDTIESIKKIFIESNFNIKKTIEKAEISFCLFRRLNKEYFPELKVIKESAKSKYTKEQILAAYEKAEGNISKACKILKIRFVPTFYRYTKRFNIKLNGKGRHK